MQLTPDEQEAVVTLLEARVRLKVMWNALLEGSSYLAVGSERLYIANDVSEDIIDTMLKYNALVLLSKYRVEVE